MKESRRIPKHEATFFPSRAKFRAWLEANHHSAGFLQVGFYKRESGRPTVAYEEAVEEALCFGWIDGVRHSVDRDSYTGRFSPRRPGSKWSAVNIRRVEALKQRGLLHEAGLRAFESRGARESSYSYGARQQALHGTYVSQIKANRAAWRFFHQQAAWYQRAAGLWVMDAKREETRQRRLATLITDSAAGRRIAPLTSAGKPQTEPPLASAEGPTHG